MKLSIITALKDSEDGHRGRLWAFVRERLEREYDAEIVVGTDDSEPFCKTRALNRAVAASSGDVLYLVDADTWVPREQVTEALEQVGERWFRPYRIKLKLGPEDTQRALAGWTFERYRGQKLERATPFKWAPPLVLTREMYEAVGGHDERFVGYGSEDKAFALSLEALFGPQVSIPGYAWHLWHPRNGRSGHDLWDGQESMAANEALLKDYRLARSPAAMRALISAR